jgi:hypothetical protein
MTSPSIEQAKAGRLARTHAASISLSSDGDKSKLARTPRNPLKSPDPDKRIKGKQRH